MTQDVLGDGAEGDGCNEAFERSAQFEPTGGSAPLFRDRDLARALHASLLDETPYAGDAAEAHRSLLRALLNRADGLVKPGFVPDGEALAHIAAVGASSPNATQAVEVVRHAAALARATGSPLRVPPILVHRSPGSGNTKLAGAIVEALGLTLEFASRTTMADSGGLCDYGRAWRNPGMGTIARTLVAAPTLAIGLVPDEVDEVGSHVQRQDARDGLLALLEPSTAARWSDDWLGVETRGRSGVGDDVRRNRVALGALPRPLHRRRRAGARGAKRRSPPRWPTSRGRAASECTTCRRPRRAHSTG